MQNETDIRLAGYDMAVFRPVSAQHGNSLISGKVAFGVIVTCSCTLV